MKIICNAILGSRGYGLSTPNSDIDKRGVFVNTDPKFIVGLNKCEHQTIQNEKEDSFFWELRHALHLLERGNTQLCELLYNEKWEEISDEWRLVIQNRHNLLSSKKLFSSLRGYIQNEFQLANGSRVGKPGGKRSEAIKNFGFSPSNFGNAYRLAYCGGVYFQKGYFPVDLSREDSDFYDSLMRLKTEPEKATVKELNEVAKVAEETLVLTFETRKFNTVFNIDVANKICLDIYGKILNDISSRENQTGVGNV